MESEKSRGNEVACFVIVVAFAFLGGYLSLIVGEGLRISFRNKTVKIGPIFKVIVIPISVG